MQVKLYEVFIPCATSKRLFVPKYDIPMVKALWNGHLVPNGQIEVADYGMLAFRPLSAEWERITRDYAAAPDNGDGPAWKMIYGSIHNFTEAWRREGEVGEKLNHTAEEFKAANPPTIKREGGAELRPLTDNLEDDASLDDEAQPVGASVSAVAQDEPSDEAKPRGRPRK